ncbi:peptidase M61 domain-containing protein, partial [mine drainage metagenome]
MTIHYRVDAARPDEHRARFSVEVPDVRGPSLDLVVPSWVPGSYHLVNYVRGFRDVTARNAADGAALRVDRAEASRWRVHTGGAPAVRFDYSVYGHEMVTEAFDRTSDHLFLNAALALPFVDGRLGEPVEVELQLPRDWTVVTELEEVRAQPPTF